MTVKIWTSKNKPAFLRQVATPVFQSTDTKYEVCTPAIESRKVPKLQRGTFLLLWVGTA